MKTQIKTNFHKLIDNTDNVDILESFFNAMSYYVAKKGKKDIVDELNNKQRKKLVASIKQAEKGNIITHKEMKSEIKQWLTK